ncbi:MAG: exo-alpha-sialidase [Deltaproteobacteria bacterium]|nr:exo-alpha-sialidase [Deltaproteobacteria bacterium]
MIQVRRGGTLLLLVGLGGCPSSTTDPGSDAAPGQDTSPSDAAAPTDTPDADPVTDASMPSGVGTGCRQMGNPFPPQQGSCPAGRLCLTEALGFRGGYCTSLCVGASRCPADSVCTAFGTGYQLCLQRCQSNDDCRRSEGYVCQRPEGSGERVCRFNDEPRGERPDGGACYTTAAGEHQLAALPRTTFPSANVSTSAERADTVIEAEGNIAINPRTGHVANAYIAASGRGSFMGVSHSMDGTAWLRNGSVVDGVLNAASDPVLDYTRDGRLRMTFIGLQRDGFGRVLDAHVRVALSANDGTSWEMARQVEPQGTCMTGSGGLCDKPWIISGPAPIGVGGGVGGGAGGGADGGAAENLYISYLSAGRMGVNLVLQRSEDAGAAWLPPVTLASQGFLLGAVSSPNLVQLAVNASGVLGAAWVNLAGMNEDGSSARFGSLDNHIMFRRSTNGGRSFEPLRVVSRPEDQPVYEQPPVVLDGSVIHVAYVNGTGNPGAWDLVLATSVDGGMSWRHRPVNDDPEPCATHAFPAMVVDGTTHDVHLIWLDNRFGEGQVAYARCPGDPSRPCGRNEAVTDRAFRFTTGRNPQTWHGDYLGLAIAADGTLWATWSDTREGSPHMYAARGRAR